MEKILKNGHVVKLAGYRVNGKSYDTEGSEIKEVHEKDCFCCRKNIMKTCTHCKKEKELSEFHANKNYKDGKHCNCKECLLEMKRVRYQWYYKENTGTHGCKHCGVKILPGWKYCEKHNARS